MRAEVGAVPVIISWPACDNLASLLLTAAWLRCPELLRKRPAEQSSPGKKKNPLLPREWRKVQLIRAPELCFGFGGD